MVRLARLFAGGAVPWEKRLAKARQRVVNENAALRDAEHKLSWQRQPMPRYNAEQAVERQRVRADKAQADLDKMIAEHEERTGA